MSYEGKSREQLIAELEEVKRRLVRHESLQKEREKVEERFRLVMDVCKDGIWDWNIETGDIYYSPGFADMLGYTGEELSANIANRIELIHPDDRNNLKVATKDCIENRSSRFSIEFRMRTRTGSWLWVMGRGHVVERDADSKATRMVGTYSDIARLKESEDRYHSLFETASSAIVTINLRGDYMSWNSVWSEMLGYSDEEIRNCNAFDVTHPDDREEGGNRIASIMSGEIKGYRQQKRFIRRDGSILWADLSASALKNGDGEIEALLGVIIDITEQKMAEEAVKESEQRYRAMVQSMSSGLAVYEAVDDGADFIFKEFNPAAEEMTKVNREQAMNSSLLKLFPEMAQSALLKALRRVWRTGEPEQLPPFYFKDSIREGWCKNRLYKLPSEEVVALFDDVTDRIETSKALESSEERLKLALNAVNDAVWDWNIHTGYTYFSPSWYTMLGYEPYEMPQNFDTWKNLVHANDRGWATKEIVRHIESGESFKVEIRMRTKGGQWRWILGRGMVVEADENGRALRMIGTHVDITDRVEAIEALKESEQRFRNLLENVEMVAVHGYDEEHRVIFWNKACEVLYGYAREEVFGQRVMDMIVPENSRHEIVQMLDSLVNDGVPFPTGEYSLEHKDGSLLSVYSSNATQVNPQGKKELYFIDVDLTEIKRTYSQLIEAKEQAEAASRAKSMFLANMSHELRTPLNGIIGMHDVMALHPLDEKQQEYLSLAQVSAKRLTNLLNDILDLTRVEAGRMKLNLKSFNLADILSDIEQLFKASSSREDVECRFAADLAIPATLVGDPARLQQILNNLVGNAIKFTPTGRVDIHVSPLPSGRNDQCRLLFSVSDTGAGIPDSKLHSLFESFTQGDDGYTRNHQGAGLGLSIVKQLVSLMGGNMSVVSEIGKGTTFYFSLPFCLQGPLEEETVTSSSHSPTRPLRLKVLLVEDDQISQLVLMKLLEREGCEVCVAENGEQAIQTMQTNDFDVVFMDVQMPIMDGVQATRAIRNGATGENRKEIPVIALTAYAMAGDREKLLQAGMNDYIEKPVDLERFKQMLEQVRSSLYTRVNRNCSNVN